MMPSRVPSFPAAAGSSASSLRAHPYQNISGAAAPQQLLHHPHAPRRGTQPFSSSFSLSSPPPPPLAGAGFYHTSGQFGGSAVPSSPGLPPLRVKLQKLEVQVSSFPPAKQANLFCQVCSFPFVERHRTLPCYHVVCGQCAEEIQAVGKCARCDANVTRLQPLHPADDTHVCHDAEDCGCVFLNSNSRAYHAFVAHQLPVCASAAASLASAPREAEEEGVRRLLEVIREVEERRVSAAAARVLPLPSAVSPAAAASAPSSVNAPPHVAEASSLGVSASFAAPPSSLASAAALRGLQVAAQSPAEDSAEKLPPQGGMAQLAASQPRGAARFARKSVEQEYAAGSAAAFAALTAGGGERAGREEGKPQAAPPPARGSVSAAAVEEEDEDLEGVL
ncbi:hypothetical protein BESB_036780 [Besnoitia besnoiti]|uniref:RING-type domain-containing protein n=1 Tax=Besnoitia besnoiti TaxID=94643 RepID=A0A2A9MNF8_BESBE|nr:hypothetical protein BESB_036780 [Besnoitia besnoiti]PFH37220.1 hypothetical protein BESB_036780 [Besnoitia besnoiti]